MRLSIFCTLLLSFAFTTFSFGQKQITSATIKTMDQQSVDLADVIQEADYTVVSFWATWCKPCQSELDAFADQYEGWQADLKDEHSASMQVVAITIDTRRQLAKVPGILSTKGWDFTILSDANNVMRNQLGFQAIPQTYVVDKEGNILYDHSGYTAGDENELFDTIMELAEGK